MEKKYIMTKEVKVGDIFEVDGIKIQAQITYSGCWDCYFSKGYHCIRPSYDDIVGDCNDGEIELIFKEI